jgi:hypothetical protein
MIARKDSLFSPAINLSLLFCLSVLCAYAFFQGPQTANMPVLQDAAAQTSPSAPQLKPIVGTVKPSSIVLMKIERLPTPVKVGDAAINPSSLNIVSTQVSEECCYIIKYTPGTVGIAGLAYKADQNYDLTKAKRIVFFAKGESGGETVRFVAVGKDISPAPTVPSTGGEVPSPAALFRNQKFQIISQDVVLDKIWKRYQLSIEGIDLTAVTYPFGFIINKAQNAGAISFSLRDITYDASSATSPVPLAQDPTSVSSATIQSNDTGGIENNTANIESPAITSSVQDSQGNASGSLGLLNPSGDPAITDSPSSTNMQASLANATMPVSTFGQPIIADSNQSLILDNTTSANRISQLSESLTPSPAPSSRLYSSGSQNQPLTFPIPDPFTTNRSAETQAPEYGNTDVITEGSGTAADTQQLITPQATAEIMPQVQQQVSPPVMSSYALDIFPPETAVTSVTDNITGSNIQNGATTSSPLIGISFEGIDDLGISGYVCTLDGLPSYYCTSPVAVDNNIYNGWSGNGGLLRIFQVSAIDASGNIDPAPAIFNWIMVPADSQEILPQPTVPQEILPQPTVPQEILPQPTVPQEILPQPTVPQEILPQLLAPTEIIIPQTTSGIG